MTMVAASCVVCPSVPARCGRLPGPPAPFRLSAGGWGRGPLLLAGWSSSALRPWARCHKCVAF